MQYFKDTDSMMGYLKEASAKQQAEFNNSKDLKNNSFYLKYGASSEILFLDDIKFVANLHKIKSGQFYLTETCIRDIEGDCPLDDGNKPSLSFVTTIFKLSYSKPDAESDGLIKLEKPFKQLFICKKGNAERLLRRQKDLGTLVGKKFKMVRSHDSKGENTGTDLDFVKDVELKKLKQFVPEGIDAAEWVAPFNYEEIFKPKSASELMKLVGINPPIGSEDAPLPQQEQQQPSGQKKALEDLL